MARRGEEEATNGLSNSTILFLFHISLVHSLWSYSTCFNLLSPAMTCSSWTKLSCSQHNQCLYNDQRDMSRPKSDSNWVLKLLNTVKALKHPFLTWERKTIPLYERMQCKFGGGGVQYMRRLSVVTRASLSYVRKLPVSYHAYPFEGLFCLLCSNFIQFLLIRFWA
jgi:hypothetical protein